MLWYLNGLVYQTGKKGCGETTSSGGDTPKLKGSQKTWTIGCKLTIGKRERITG